MSIFLRSSLANVFIYSVRQKDFYDEMINWYEDLWKGTVCRCLLLVKRESSVESMSETTARSNKSNIQMIEEIKRTFFLKMSDILKECHD